MTAQHIDQVPLFLKLSEEERELVSARLRPIEFKTNDTIFSAGKPAEMLAIIDQGWVKLENQGPQGRVALANLGPGSVLGEVDLLLDRPHSSWARAASPTHLLALYPEDLRDLILERPTIGLSFSASLGTRIAYLDEYLLTHRLPASPLFGSLDPEQMRALAATLEFRSISGGEALFEAGGDGEAAFLIEAGKVRGITSSRAGESFEEFEPGDTLGHASLITGKAYTSTARAVTDLDVWVLTRVAYEQLVLAQPAIKPALSRSLAETLNKDDQARAVEQLCALPLFADVESQALEEMASCLVLRHFPKGEMIYAEGTPGDAVYLVESGSVQLLSDSTPQARLLDHKSDGLSFGEMALLTGRPRAEAAQASQDTTVWVLYKGDYDELIVRHPSASLALSRALSERLGSPEPEQVDGKFSGFRLFVGLSQVELQHVAQFVKPLRFSPGETVCFAGQNAQYVYLISQGEVREITAGSNGQALVVALHGQNESFGERAVMRDGAYPTTMQAVGDVRCMTIAKPDFERLVSLHPVLALNLTKLMGVGGEQAIEKPAVVSMAPLPRPGVPPPPPRAVTYNGTHRTNGTRPPPVPRPPSPSKPVPVPPTAAVSGVRAIPGKPWERPNSVMRPMPAANGRPIAVNGAPAGRATGTSPVQVAPRGVSGLGSELVGQVSGLSQGGKVKLGVLTVAGLFLVLVIPLLLIFGVLSTSGAFAGFSGAAPSSRDLPANFDGEGVQRAALAQMSGKLAVRERTATPTPLPPTAVPTLKATVKPTAKKPVAAAPKAQPKPTQQATATTAAIAAAAAPDVPALPPRIWDKRLGPGGLPLLTQVGVTDASVQSGQYFFRLTKMIFQDAGAESGNDHTIYIAILDENGVRDDGENVMVSWNEAGGLEQQVLTAADQKPAGDYCNCNYNWPMFGAGYSVRINGSLPSDLVYGMIMPEHQHVNYLLTFQKMLHP